MTVAWRKWAHDRNLIVNNDGKVRRLVSLELPKGFWFINYYPANYPTSGSKFYVRMRANVIKMMKV